MLSLEGQLDSMERRRFKREDLKLWARFKSYQQGKISEPLESITANISAGGAALRSDHHVETDQLLMITLFLPPEESRKTVGDTMIFEENLCTSVNVLAKVTWCSASSDSEYYFGVQFIELDDYSRQLLKGYLKHYDIFSADTHLYN